MEDIIFAMTLCNKATFSINEKIGETNQVNTISKMQILGTPSDVAMLKYVAQLINVNMVRLQYPVWFV